MNFPSAGGADVSTWWAGLPASVRSAARTVAAIVVIGGSLLTVTRILAAQMDLPQRVQSNTDRIGRVEVRVDSLLRITTQTFCLQKAQAQRTDWSECVK